MLFAVFSTFIFKPTNSPITAEDTPIDCYIRLKYLTSNIFTQRISIDLDVFGHETEQHQRSKRQTTTRT